MAPLAVLGLLVSTSGYSQADPPDRPEPLGSGRPTVTLPTGDRVDVFADGTLGFADGVRYDSLVLPNGDRVPIPASALDDVRQGRLDARLFNVDALLRDGVTDASAVSTPDSLGEPIVSRQSVDASDATVTATFSWLDGSVPAEASLWWLNQATGDYEVVFASDGVAAVALPPGEYSVLLDMNNGLPDDAPWEAVGTFVDVTVADTPVTLTVDGTTAKPVDVAVDHADAVKHWSETQFYTNRTDGSRGITHLYGARDTDHIYAIPSAQPAGQAAGLSLRTELTNPPGAAEPYSYDLFNLADKGIPADPTFVVHDDELAVRHTTYHGLGGKPVQMTRRNLGDHPDRSWSFVFPGSPVMVPSTRTEYYTAGPDVTWLQVGVLGGETEGAPEDDVLRDTGTMAVGEHDDHWLSGPLSVRVPDPQYPLFLMGLRREPAFNGQPAKLVAFMPMFSSGDEGEFVGSSVPGASTISKDGVELATSPYGSSVTADLPKDDAGRFTLTMDAKRDVPWTPFGSHSTATWAFDSAPVSEGTVLGVSAVRFDSPDVVDGYAERDKPQRVELEYETQNGAEDRACEDMTFEVSYDDGATWAGVDIARDGDHATATLNHPDGAQFVSVRFTAVDDLGQTVETSTIRSFGLR
jgi:hypothetical protein